MNLAFQPHKDFLAPYVAAAASLSNLSDEFMDHLKKTLEERDMAVRRMLCTRRASAFLNISEPLCLVSDFSDELEGSDVLVELVRELREVEIEESEGTEGE